MIPTIETIVEDLMAGTITKQQAIGWLYQHAEDAGLTLRDDFAASVIGHLVCAEVRQDFTTEKDAAYAYDVADAMMEARKKAPNTY